VTGMLRPGGPRPRPRRGPGPAARARRGRRGRRAGPGMPRAARPRAHTCTGRPGSESGAGASDSESLAAQNRKRPGMAEGLQYTGDSMIFFVLKNMHMLTFWYERVWCQRTENNTRFASHHGAGSLLVASWSPAVPRAAARRCTHNGQHCMGPVTRPVSSLVFLLQNGFCMLVTVPC